jgi:L-lactate dehydrogenase complex protein LldF
MPQPESATDSTLTERAELALENAFLRRAVRFTTDRLRDAKARSTAELGDWERWREAGRAIRAHVIENLDVYLAQFARNVAERGGHVHFAADASEANALVAGLARTRGAKLAVKSKSMVTEELHLNAALETAGVEALETDLGEWIVQLAHETPSHIILPVIHKSRDEIRALFVAHGGEALSNGTAELAGYARRKLRERFLAADVGITGCNFAVASTGSIALFTNEGNGRMVTTLPREHVVVMGMERIVPTLDDLDVMARLLPRSATGQKITTYLNLITGPRRRGEIDGPEELHVIVLDNGRSQQLGDREVGDVLNCIRCGACLNVCPVYRQIGGHAYGSVYPGPIGAVLTPLLQPESKRAAELAGASSLCGACFEACPVKIPLHDMLVTLRARQVERGETPALERTTSRVAARILASPGLFGAAARIARTVQRATFRDGRRARWFVRRLGPLAGWTSSRDLPAMPRRSFRELWPDLERELEADRKKGSDA